MCFAIFPVHVSKVPRLPRKSDAKSYEVLHLSRKIISAKSEDLMLRNATLLRKSAPWPPNISYEHVSCTAPATQNASLQFLFKCPTPAIVFGNAREACHAKRHLNFQKCSEPISFLHYWLGDVLRATTACTFLTSQLPKVIREWCVLMCFVHFDLEMCFAPQRHALFRHLNFQEWSAAGVFCTFWLPDVLCATSACNFSSLIWPDCSAPAALASLLFNPPEPQTMGKTQCSATFYLFAHLHLLSSDSFSSLIFFLLTLSLLWLFPPLLLHLGILSQVWLLNFLRL